jgi:folylpolyglutamate synthase/dihydropteroate synthase
MTWNLDPKTTLAMEESRRQGLKSAISEAEADVARAKARRAESDAEAARQAAATATRGRSSDRKRIAILQDALAAAQEAKIRAQLDVQARDQVVRERDALILDWIHSHEAYKRLAKTFSGKSDEDLREDLRDAIFALAEEDPARFAGTSLTRKVREIRGLK